MSKSPPSVAGPVFQPAGDLDMPAERRAAAQAHVAVLSATMAKVALTLPLGADVDDFRRVLASAADRPARRGGKA